MDIETEEFIQAVKYFSGDKLKTLQRQLTTAANTIDRHALSSHVRPLLKQEEVDTLRKAIGVLSNIKRTVEHAKEKRLRDERTRPITQAL